MTVRELEVDREDLEAERVACPTCGRPLWLGGDRSMAIGLRDCELATAANVVNVIVTGAFPMVFANCKCKDTLHIKIRRPMPFVDRGIPDEPDPNASRGERA